MELDLVEVAFEMEEAFCMRFEALDLASEGWSWRVYAFGATLRDTERSNEITPP
jgi:hypothetical protein